MKNLLNRKVSFILILSLSVILCGCKEKKKVQPVLDVKSEPSGANVSIQNRELGKTPYQIKLQTPGTRIVKVYKEGYRPIWGKIMCLPNKENLVDVKLKPVTSSVIIRSKPSGARITMDGAPIGETPILLQNQAIGSYSCRANKAGFAEIEERWEIVDSRPKVVTILMSSNVGTLNVTSSPKKALLFIDGDARGQTPFSGRLEIGEHNIVLKKPGYGSFKQKVIIERNKEEVVRANLNILPGHISISSTPSGAMCFVNGKQQKKTPLTLRNLPPGKYEIKVTKKGFDPETREVSVSPERMTEVEFSMNTNMGGIDLVANPPGVSIYLDGKRIGTTEPEEDGSKLSKRFEINNLSPGKYTLEFAHKRAIPTKKRITVTVKKGQITRLPENIEMWIADTIITMKDSGKKLRGRLVSENDNEIFFEPEPHIKQKFKKDEIKEIKELEYKD